MNGAYRRPPTAWRPATARRWRCTVDNLIRRRLRIGDPRDPREVADGLRRLFAGDARALDAARPRACRLLPPTRHAAVGAAESTAASGAELDQAIDDVERDLRALTTDSQLKDIEPELQGWGQAIRGIVADGTAAARACARSAGARPRLRRPPAARRLRAAGPARRRADRRP